MHDFKINGFNTDRWGLVFMTGAYQELVKAPTRKASTLTMSWSDQDGVETDRTYNYYESKPIALQVAIKASSENELITKYNQFVQELLLTGDDIIIDVYFLERRFTLRYQAINGTVWRTGHVAFTLQLIDDYPATITPIP